MRSSIMRSIAITSGAMFLCLAVPPPVRADLDLGPLSIRLSTSAPPPGRYEARPVRTHPQAVWIDGYWDRQGDQWAWVNGRWEQPGHPNIHWVTARYNRQGCHWYGSKQNCSWRYEPAHWSNQQLVSDHYDKEWKEHQQKGNNRR